MRRPEDEPGDADRVFLGTWRLFCGIGGVLSVAYLALPIQFGFGFALLWLTMSEYFLDPTGGAP